MREEDRIESRIKRFGRRARSGTLSDRRDCAECVIESSERAIAAVRSGTARRRVPSRDRDKIARAVPGSEPEPVLSRSARAGGAGGPVRRLMYSCKVRSSSAPIKTAFRNAERQPRTHRSVIGGRPDAERGDTICVKDTETARPGGRIN